MDFKFQKGKFDLKDRWPALLMFALLAAQFIFIVYINLFHLGDTIDEDFSGMLTHTMEIARNKKLLLDNWFYPTTGEFDTSLFPAVFLYLISGNIYLSFGIVNILNAILIGYVFYRVLGIAGAGKEYILMGMCMALAAYDFGMLSYANMLFFNGSQYVYKAVLPLLFLAVLFSSKKEGDKRSIVDCVLFYGLYFLTVFSSGIYVFLCGLIPVFVTCMVITLFKNELDKKRLILHGGCVFGVTFIGVILHSAAGLEMHSFNSNLMKLRHDMGFFEAFGEVADTFVKVIDPVVREMIDATSFLGVAGGMKWLMLVMICMGLAFIPSAFGFGLISGREKESTLRSAVSSCAISVFIFNSFILLITVSKSRYHLIGFFPLIVCAVLMIENNLSKIRLLNRCFTVLVTAMYGCLLIANITYNAPMYFAHRNLENYYLDEDFCRSIKECADRYGVSTVFFVNVIEDAEIMRLYDTSHSYVTYKGQTREIVSYDGYITELDKSRFEDRNLIAVSDEGMGTLSSFITDNYEVVDHIGRYDIMICDYSPMDGGTFLFKDSKTIDLPVSPGYEYQGDIGVTGYLFSVSEGTVLSSPEFEPGRAFCCTLNYDLDGSDGTEAVLGVYRNGELMSTLPLDPSEHSVSFDGERKGKYSFEIQKRGGGVITVREIEFE